TTETPAQRAPRGQQHSTLADRNTLGISSRKWTTSGAPERRNLFQVSSQAPSCLLLQRSRQMTRLRENAPHGFRSIASPSGIPHAKLGTTDALRRRVCVSRGTGTVASHNCPEEQGHSIVIKLVHVCTLGDQISHPGVVRTQYRVS